jgi:hypothetical protein
VSRRHRTCSPTAIRQDDPRTLPAAGLVDRRRVWIVHIANHRSATLLRVPYDEGARDGSGNGMTMGLVRTRCDQMEVGWLARMLIWATRNNISSVKSPPIRRT